MLYFPSCLKLADSSQDISITAPCSNAVAYHVAADDKPPSCRQASQVECAEMLPLANWYHSQAVGPISLAPEGDDVHYLSLTKLAQGCCNRLIFLVAGGSCLASAWLKLPFVRKGRPHFPVIVGGWSCFLDFSSPCIILFHDPQLCFASSLT